MAEIETVKVGHEIKAYANLTTVVGLTLMMMMTIIITFCVSRIDDAKCIEVTRVCVSVCVCVCVCVRVSAAVRPHYCTRTRM